MASERRAEEGQWRPDASAQEELCLCPVDVYVRVYVHVHAHAHAEGEAREERGGLGEAARHG